MNFNLFPKRSIYASFGLVILLILLALFLSMKESSREEKNMQMMVNNNSTKNVLFSKMIFHVADRVLILQSIVLSQSHTKRIELYSQLTEHDGHYLEIRKKLLSLPLDKQEKYLLEQQYTSFIFIESEQGKSAQLLLEGKDKQAKQIILNIVATQEKMLQTINKMTQHLNHKNNHQHQESSEQVLSSKNIIYFLAFTIILIILFLAWIVYRNAQNFIYALKDSYTKIKQSENRERKIRDLIIDSLIITDHKGLITEFNKAAEKDFGYTKDEIIGKNVSLLMTSADMEHHDQYMDNYMQTGKNKIIGIGREVIVKRKDDSTFFADLSISKIDTDGPPLFMGTIHDVSARKENELQLIQRQSDLEQRVQQRTEELANANTLLSQQANFDALTGLANRHLFFDRLRQAIGQAKRHNYKLAILFIDLDGFKKINDNYGHSTGDKVLKKISRRMRQCLRDEDTVSRIGGDEFAIVLNEVKDTSLTTNITTKIINIINKPLNITEDDISVGASIGISVYPENDLSPEKLLKQADIAMYISKDNGKNTYTFFENNNDD